MAITTPTRFLWSRSNCLRSANKLFREVTWPPGFRAGPLMKSIWNFSQEKNFKWRVSWQMMVWCICIIITHWTLRHFNERRMIGALELKSPAWLLMTGNSESAATSLRRLTRGQQQCSIPPRTLPPLSLISCEEVSVERVEAQRRLAQHRELN